MTDSVSFTSTSTSTSTSTRTWSVVQLRVEGRPLIALVNSAYRAFPDKARFPWCLPISTPLSQPTPPGLATAAEGQALERFQQQTIIPILSAHCGFHLVARTTQNGIRDLIFYIDSPASVVAALNNLLEFGGARSFTFGAVYDQNWRTAGRYLNRPEREHASWLPWRRRRHSS